MAGLLSHRGLGEIEGALVVDRLASSEGPTLQTALAVGIAPRDAGAAFAVLATTILAAIPPLRAGNLRRLLSVSGLGLSVRRPGFALAAIRRAVFRRHGYARVGAIIIMGR